VVELYQLSHLVRAGSKKGRIPPRLVSSIERIAYAVQRRSRDPYTSRVVDELIRVARTGDAERTDRYLRVLRNQIRRPSYPEPLTLELRSRVNQLESENVELRTQLEVANRDKQENAVKKFIASKNPVFVIMPFDQEFNDVWTGGIRRACDDCGFASLRVDQVSLSSWITDDVEEYIQKSKTVISDVTNNNSNVMFELGYAMAKEKDPIIISQHRESEKVPFDIAGIRRLEYHNTWQGIEILARKLKEYLQATSELQTKRESKSSKTRKIPT